MNGDALQRVYDEVSAAAERNTPGASRDPADLEWLDRVRRLRWAAAWAATPNPATPTMPPLPPGGGGGGGGARSPGGGAAGGVAREGGDATADTPEGGTFATTIEADTPEGGTFATTIETDAADFGDAVAAAAAATSSSTVSDVVLGIPVANLSFASGPLAPAWAIIKETWTQADGVLSCTANASGKAVALYAGQIMSGLHQAALIRPSGTVAVGGIMLCCTVDALGQTSGYCFLISGASCLMYRIDADVWTSIGSALHGGYTVGMSLSIQRNGGNIRGFVNGVLKLNIADATYTSGYGGIGATGTGQLANFWTNA